MKTPDFRSASGHRAARVCATVVVAACLASLAACSHMPWQHKVARRPEAVSVLVELAADGVPTDVFPQYWKRNTLVVDLTTAASNGGALTLMPRQGAKWPVRIAFRVMPGSVGLLEVQADQRLLMPVAREGTAPVDLELVPGVYTSKTPRIIVKWEALKPPPS
jgi:hypothetical protein